MSNKFKDIDIKNYTYHFFNDIINIKSFDPNKIKIDEKLYENILISSVNPLYLIINKTNEQFEEINAIKYLTLVPTNNSKEIKKNHEELWNKIRDLIKSLTKNSNDYDEIYMKIKFNLVDELPQI